MTTSPEDLGDGIGVIPLPIPFKGLDWVNAYVIAGKDGLVLIDCGVDGDEGHEALTQGLRALGHDLGSAARTIDATGRLVLPGGVEAQRVYDLAEASDGSLWFATNDGIHRLREGKWRSWSDADGDASRHAFG